MGLIFNKKLLTLNKLMKTKERTFWEIFKRFFEPYLQYKIITIKAIFMYSMWAIAPIIHILFAQKIISAIEHKEKELFWKVVLLYIVVFIVQNIIDFLVRKWWWVETVNSYRKYIHGVSLRKFITLSNTEVEKLWTGKTISLVDKWTDIWALYLDKIIQEITQIFIALIFTFYMIFSIKPIYAVVFILLYLFVHVIAEYFNKKTLKFRRKRQDTWNEYVWLLVKILMSKFEILQTNKISQELEKADRVSQKLVDWNMLMATPNHWLYFFPEIFMGILKIILFVFLGAQIIEWKADFALFVWVFGLLTLMDWVVDNSTKFYSHLTKDFTKIEKMWDFFDTTPDIKWYDTWKEFEYKKGAIKIKDLDFWYTKKQKVFNRFNLKIEGWKVTALVWNSGSWKSTLVKLISWYIRQDSWKIIVDGQSLEKVSLKSYYKNIGYLTQEPSVFDGTIRDNLMYAVNDFKNTDNLAKVIKQAQCEFIYDLENGLDTEIWEKGIRLSWWQRQRLAIAKIFLKNPKIIILDEPTSALDSFSEEQITKAMHNLFKKRTVIIIAHRLQTVKNAERILVLEDGKVVEEGNHKSLVKQKWIYKKMLDLQSGF